MTKVAERIHIVLAILIVVYLLFIKQNLPMSSFEGIPTIPLPVPTMSLPRSIQFMLTCRKLFATNSNVENYDVEPPRAIHVVSIYGRKAHWG